MIHGIDVFRAAFSNFSESYILIGGAACNVLLEKESIPFRVTHDLDIVLCIEALSSDFGKAFWAFIKRGEYQIQEKSSGEKNFYRFRNPRKKEYPLMLELFSRKPNLFELSDESHLTPIPFDDEVSSLSAILLDEAYYDFIQNHRMQIEDISLLSFEALIALKAKAWLDLSDRKGRGELIDSKNIRKHKNDICRLFAGMKDVRQIEVATVIREDMKRAIATFQDEEFDMKALNLPITKTILLEGMADMFL